MRSAPVPHQVRNAPYTFKKRAQIATQIATRRLTMGWDKPGQVPPPTFEIREKKDRTRGKGTGWDG
jgi:hypothetical protein